MIQDLVSQLTSQLGVTEDQAKGGAGALFNIAKDKLGAGEFSQITSAIPGVTDLMSAAPAATTEGESSGGGLMGMAASALGAVTGGGGALGKLGAMASAASAFKSLGLDTGMITKFLPIVMGFAKTQGGEGVQGLLSKVMGGND